MSAAVFARPSSFVLAACALSTANSRADSACASSAMRRCRRGSSLHGRLRASTLLAGRPCVDRARMIACGVYLLGNGHKEFAPYDSVVAQYQGAGWSAPKSFEWRDLSFEPAGPEAVVVAGRHPLWGGGRPAHGAVVRRAPAPRGRRAPGQHPPRGRVGRSEQPPAGATGRATRPDADGRWLKSHAPLSNAATTCRYSAGPVRRPVPRPLRRRLRRIRLPLLRPRDGVAAPRHRRVPSNEPDASATRCPTASRATHRLPPTAQGSRTSSSDRWRSRSRRSRLRVHGSIPVAGDDTGLLQHLLARTNGFGPTRGCLQTLRSGRISSAKCNSPSGPATGRSGTRRCRASARTSGRPTSGASATRTRPADQRAMPSLALAERTRRSWTLTRRAHTHPRGGRPPCRPPPARAPCRPACRTRRPRTSARGLSARRARAPCHAEVDHDRVTLLEEHVRRLEVAVDDAPAVRVGERVGDVTQEPHRLGDRELARRARAAPAATRPRRTAWCSRAARRARPRSGAGRRAGAGARPQAHLAPEAVRVDTRRRARAGAA